MYSAFTNMYLPPPAHQAYNPNNSSLFKYSNMEGEKDYRYLPKGFERRTKVEIVKEKIRVDTRELRGDVVNDQAVSKETFSNASATESDEDAEAKEGRNASETFVAVIAQSILSVPTKRMTLSSIYSFIAKHYPHFDKEKGAGWRNSVRHNLSSNDCFVKASRAENGKGHYWMIHPKDLPEFSKGNFRRPRKPRRPRCTHASLGCTTEKGIYGATLPTGYPPPPYTTKTFDMDYPALPYVTPEMYSMQYAMPTRYDCFSREDSRPGIPTLHSFSSPASFGMSWQTQDDSAFKSLPTTAYHPSVRYPCLFIPPVSSAGNHDRQLSQYDNRNIKVD